MRKVIPPQPLQDVHRGFIERHRVWPTVLVVVACNPEMTMLQADLFPLEPHNVGLAKNLSLNKG